VIEGQGPFCKTVSKNGYWEGLCQAFRLNSTQQGVAEIVLDWDFKGGLLFIAKPPAGEVVRQTAGSAPHILRVPVTPGSTLILEAYYAGRPEGYPRSIQGGPVSVTATMMGE
jgi:hypothetical protein